MNSAELMVLEREIQALLASRLSKFEYDRVVIEAYLGMEGSTVCRIELFAEETNIRSRVAKYEAKVGHGFYFRAESSLRKQLCSKSKILGYKAML